MLRVGSFMCIRNRKNVIAHYILFNSKFCKSRMSITFNVFALKILDMVSGNLGYKVQKGSFIKAQCTKSFNFEVGIGLVRGSHALTSLLLITCINSVSSLN